MSFNLMPLVAAIGTIVIIVVYLIVRGMERRAEFSGVDKERLNSFIEEIKRENAEIRKDLQTVKTKVEAIDGMMKEI